MEVMEERGGEEVWLWAWSTDWKVTRDEQNGGNVAGTKAAWERLPAVVQVGAIRLGVSGVSFGAAELQQQGCSSSAGQERCSRSTGVERCRSRAGVWCRSRADEKNRTVVEQDSTIEVCLGSGNFGFWEFLALGILALGIVGFLFVGLVFGRRLFDLRCSVKDPSINWCVLISLLELNRSALSRWSPRQRMVLC